MAGKYFIFNGPFDWSQGTFLRDYDGQYLTFETVEAAQAYLQSRVPPHLTVADVFPKATIREWGPEDDARVARGDLPNDRPN